MRCSTLLFAISIALHAFQNHVAEATGAASKTNQDLPILVTKSDIRNNDSSNHDERMFALDPVLLSSMPPAEVFEKIREVAKGASPIEEVHNVLQTMKNEDMELVLAAFKKKDTSEEDLSLVDQFIGGWGIDAVATVLVQAKTSKNEKVVRNGNMLLKNLMESWRSKFNEDYSEIFNQLKLKDGDKKHFVGRVELLDDYIKYRSHRQSDNILFRTLSEGFGSYTDLSHAIDVAKSVDKSAELLESRLIEYFVNAKASSSDIFMLFILPKHRQAGIEENAFLMMEEFFDFKDVASELISPNVLNEFIKGFGGEGKLAIELSKGVGRPGFDGLPREYEELLFEHWLTDLRISPDNMDVIFTETYNSFLLTEEDLAFAPVVNKRFRKYYERTLKRSRLRRRVSKRINRVNE